MANDENKLTDHNYDGIQELDNPLPDWWLITFLGTIIFAFIYYAHYESEAGLTQKQELAISLADRKTAFEKQNAAGPEHTEESLALVAFDKNSAQTVYQGKCAVCHGPDGGGSIGPNLTDKHWLHGKGQRLDILMVLQNGVLEKGMPAWRSQISESELVQLALYVHDLRNQPSTKGKPPQGPEYE